MWKRNSLLTLLLALLFLQGCAGVRNSYESLLDEGSSKPRITLKVGDKREVLAVGDGFPGWWGYYPAIASHDPEVASITCEEGPQLHPLSRTGRDFWRRTLLHRNPQGRGNLAADRPTNSRWKMSCARPISPS